MKKRIVSALALLALPLLFCAESACAGGTHGTPFGVSIGGTGATTASGARTNLGLASVAASGSASDLTTGTLGSARLPSPFTSGTASGNTSKFATVSGTLAAGNCLQIDSSGNIMDSGAACGAGGGGSGTVTSGTQYQLGYYGSTGTTISGHSGIKTDASSNLLISSGSIAVGTATPRAALDLGTTTTGILYPTWTTGTRPASPTSGTVGYNSTLQRIEAYINNKWTTWQIGENAVDVTLPPYNAACDGSTNDTTAFTNALASGYAVSVPMMANGCSVNNLTLPSGSRIIGHNAKVWYDETTGTRSWINNTSGATVILNPNGSSGVWLQNIDIAERALTWGTAVTCVAGGGASVYLVNTSLRFCGNGGLGTNADAYTNAFFSWFSNYYANGNSTYSGGVNNVIDSQIVGGAFTSNWHGIYLASGADSNAFVGVRVEWNASYGILCDSCHTNVMSAMTVDANEDAGIYLHNAGTFQFSGYLWRNGASATSGHQSHIVDAGGNSDIVINAVMKHGFDDGGGGTDRPKYALEVTGTGSTGFVLANNAMSGGYTVAPYLWTVAPSSLNIRGNATGRTPTVGTCGTSPSVTGNDEAGIISVGSGTVTACTLTHGFTNWRTWNCTANANSAAYVYVSAASASSNTFTASANIGGGKIYYRCEP